MSYIRLEDFDLKEDLNLKEVEREEVRDLYQIRHDPVKNTTKSGESDLIGKRARD